MRLSLFFASSHSNASAATRESSVGIEGLTLKDLGLDLDFWVSCYAPRQDEFVATRPVPG